MQYMNLIK